MIRARAAARAKTAILAAVAVALAAACGAPYAVYLPGGNPRLRAALEAAAEDYAKGGQARPRIVHDAAELASYRGTVLYLAVQDGWVEGVDGVGGLARELGGRANLPFDPAAWKASGSIQAVALERWGARSNVRYLAPLLWDPWGATGPAAALPQAGGVGLAGLAAAKPAGGFLYAGAESAEAQLAYWLGRPDAGKPEEAARLMASSTLWAAPGVSDGLAAFAARPLIPGGRADCVHFGNGDVANLRRADGLVLERYSAQQALPVLQVRRFRVLAWSAPTGAGRQAAIAAAVFAASLHGDPAGAGQAQGFVGFLESPAEQRRLAEASAWLPADYRAPVADAEAAAARKAAIEAERVFAIVPDDGLLGPAGRPWQRLLSDVVKSPDSARAIVAERAAKP